MMTDKIEDIENSLREATAKLNEAAYFIRKTDFGVEANLRQIGHALKHVYNIQDEIYKKHPELEPDFLKE